MPLTRRRVVEITPTQEVKGLAKTLANYELSYQRYQSLRACRTGCSDTIASDEEKKALRYLESVGLIRMAPFYRWELTDFGENYLMGIAIEVEIFAEESGPPQHKAKVLAFAKAGTSA